MNKKILVIPVLLLTFALLSIPVMGAPATKVEGVTATPVYSTTFTDSNIVDHYTVQLRGIAIGVVTLAIPGAGTLTGDYYAEVIGVVKRTLPVPIQDPDAEGIFMTHTVWTFIGEGTTGTFEGTTHTKQVSIPVPSYIERRTVLHGTGDFKGQTLKLSYEGAPPIISEGYLIIPK